MIIIVSALVGLNVVSSIHTLRVYNLEKKRKDLSSIISYRGDGTKFLSILGATSSLFTVCPTCASFYLFNMLAGPFATTVASFTVNYYLLILLVSIPLLITSPFVNALNIRKIKSIATQCNIKYKNEKM
jgi:hypothetical protein